jgi:hypothetical protein
VAEQTGQTFHGAALSQGNNAGGILTFEPGNNTGSGAAGVIKFNDNTGTLFATFNSYFAIDSSSGTFPTTGLIRTKNYAGATDIWRGYNSGEASILHQQGGTLTFGDANAVTGWSTQVNGFSLEFNGRTQATAYVPVFIFGDFATVAEGVRITPSPASPDLRFATANTTPKIWQADRTTNSGTGETLTIQAQPLFGVPFVPARARRESQFCLLCGRCRAARLVYRACHKCIAGFSVRTCSYRIAILPPLWAMWNGSPLK